MIPQIRKVLTKSNSDTLPEWTTAIRFATYSLDPRRFFPLIQLVSENLQSVSSSTSPASQSKVIMFLKAILIEISWRSPEFNIRSLSTLIKMVPDNYKQVCQAIGECISVIYVNLWKPGDVNVALQSFVDLFVDNLRREISNSQQQQSKQVASHQFATTLLHWLNHSYSQGFSHSVDNYLRKLFDLVFLMQEINDEDIKRQSISICALISQSFVSQRNFPALIQQLELVNKSANWHIRSAVLPFLQ